MLYNRDLFIPDGLSINELQEYQAKYRKQINKIKQNCLHKGGIRKHPDLHRRVRMYRNAINIATKKIVALNRIC